MQWLEQAPPSGVAVETPDGALEYGELLSRARAGAAELAGHERVAIALPPGLDFAVALHACLLAGAAAVPLDPREPVPRLAGATLTIHGPPGAAPRAAAPRAAARELSTPALVVHTSGTTGTPKPVEITLGQILHNALGCAVALGHDQRERW